MSSMSSTPNSRVYNGDYNILSDKSKEHFTEGRFVKPINRYALTLNMGNDVSVVIKLQPTQHWLVEKYNKDKDIVTLSYKSMVITLPMSHASDMFKDYNQTSDGKVLYKVGGY